MKINLKQIAAIALTSLLMFQCNKKSNDPEPTPTPDPTPSGPSLNTLADLFAANGAPTQNFTVSATTANTITANGVTIEIPANAFETTTSSTVTGNVVVSVKTILTKAQIILSGAQANSTNAKLVATKGCVKITASHNSQSLRLGSSSGGTVFVNVPDGSTMPPPMKKYYVGKLSVTDSTKVWAMESDTNDVTVAWNGSNYVQKAALDSLKWLNVGKQWDTNATKVVQQALVDSTQFNSTNCAVYISYNNSLTVGAMYPIGNSGIYRISNMPLGKGVHIVAIAVKNGQYYMAISATTIKPATESLSLQPVTLSQLTTALNALP